MSKHAKVLLKRVFWLVAWLALNALILIKALGCFQLYSHHKLY
ncbi:hypothetical protein HMPREF1432_01016 [Helicobacter pylori GAMchJs114i]|nr:hypothetical protein HMPREF1432_01016 [Helicobacter pylori GAMchJs114i]